MNATGTELLHRFGRVQSPDRKGAMEKDANREALCFVLWLLTSRGRTEDEVKTSIRALLNEHMIGHTF